MILADNLVQASGAQTLGERRPSSQGVGAFRIEEIHTGKYIPLPCRAGSGLSRVTFVVFAALAVHAARRFEHILRV